MKLYELWDEDPNAVPIKEFLERDCMPFFKRSGRQGVLYRGVNRLGDFEDNLRLDDGTVVQVYSKSVRKDRKPMSTNKYLSKILDKYFEEHLGFKGRSAGVFCTGDWRVSAGYGGNNCMMFPKSDFSYIWSPKVYDLFEAIENELEPYEYHLNGDKELAREFYRKNGEEKIFDYLKEKEYTINHLDKAVTVKNEVMIDCDEYYVIPMGSLTTTNRREVLKSLGIKP